RPWTTCSTTPPDTRPGAGSSSSPPTCHVPTRSSSRSATAGRASRRTSCRTPSTASTAPATPGAATTAGPDSASPSSGRSRRPTAPDGLPGMPPVTDPHNVYAAAGAGMLSEVARAAKPLVYVPHNRSNDVWVIDPTTFTVVARYPLGTGELQHVVPSWDLRTLY